MPYYLTNPRRSRGLGLPPLNLDGSAPMASTALVAGAAGACPGSPGCPGYQVTLQDLQNLPLVGPIYNPSPATAAQLALAASALNPNLPTGSSFTDWVNAHATAAVWIGGIAAGILLLSRL